MPCSGKNRLKLIIIDVPDISFNTHIPGHLRVDLQGRGTSTLVRLWMVTHNIPNLGKHVNPFFPAVICRLKIVATG